MLLSGQTRWEARRPYGPPLEPGGKDLMAAAISSKFTSNELSTEHTTGLPAG